MNKIRTSYVSVLALLIAGCASAPSTQELAPKVAGMSRVELLSCMGPPDNSAKDGNVEFITYSYRSTYDKYSYRCDSQFVLTDGRVSKLRVTGDEEGGYIDVTSKVCRAKIAKCVE